MATNLIDLAGKRFGCWLVSDQHRMRSTGRGELSEWLCRCDCGTEQWVNSAGLRRGITSHCKSTAHNVLVAGTQVRGTQFTILSVQVAGLCRIRCVCGRERSVTYSCLSVMYRRRTTCGCNGVDMVYLNRDPNLPQGVTNYNALIRWAGCSRQAHYQFIERKGLSAALEHLTQLAEKNHPGEGWRIGAVIPGLSEAQKEERSQ